MRRQRHLSEADMNVLDIEQQIALTEQRVYSADRRLRADRVQFSEHMQRSGNYVKPVAGVLIAAWLLRGRLLGGTRTTLLPGATRSWSWLRGLLPMLAPILGQAASRYSSAVGNKVLFRTPRPERAAPQVCASIDPVLFLGHWNVLATFSGDIERYFYQPNADGHGFSVTQKRVDRAGRSLVTHGQVRAAAPGVPEGQMSISFAPSWARWVPVVWTDHWILDLDSEYQFALIGNRSRTVLQVVSRGTLLTREARELLLRTATEEGFPADRLIWAAA